MYVIGRSRDRAAVLEEVEEAISFKLTGVGRGPRMGQGWAGPLEPCLALIAGPRPGPARPKLCVGCCRPGCGACLPTEQLAPPASHAPLLAPPAARLSGPLLARPVPALLWPPRRVSTNPCLHQPQATAAQP